MQTDYELVEMMNQARMLGASESLLYPMVEQMISKRLDVACSEFRGGKTENLVAHIGYIVGLKDLLSQLKRIQVEGNRAQMKLIDEHK